MGAEGAMGINQPILALVFMVFGTAIGELIDIDKQFNRLGNWVERKFAKESSGNFAQGFIQASLLFCIGSMTFIGALESGIMNVHTTYITKGTIDGISAITFAAANGIGVGLSAVAVLIYQGLLVALAGLLQSVLLPEVIALSAQIGSLMLIGIGLNMLNVTKIKVANFIPAMFLPILWQAISGLL